MSSPRSDVYNRAGEDVYHCVVRCVRRAFLCGKDPLTNRSFEHRRGWIRDRLSLLGKSYSLKIIAYAVMSNHLHILVKNDPNKAQGWSNLDVAKRYRSAHPVKPCAANGFKNFKEQVEEIAKNEELVSLYRERLSNLSWFMKALNEPIARRANREDECTGKFWESRFQCKKVSSVKGILACSVYIDLNPLKANMARSPRSSRFTSVAQRIESEYLIKTRKQGVRISGTIVPLISISEATEGTLSLETYLNLVYKTGRAIQDGRRAERLKDEMDPVLKRLSIRSENWLDTVQTLDSRFCKVVGSSDELSREAKTAGKAWLHGMKGAAKCFG